MQQGSHRQCESEGYRKKTRAQERQAERGLVEEKQAERKIPS
jgi:hypothetical protein